MAAPFTFPGAFATVRSALGLTQERVAQLHGVSTRTVERWSLGHTLPSLHDRTQLLRTLRDAPRALLEDLARASGTTLEAAGLAPARPATETPAGRRAVDEAVRELADDLDLTASALRPGLGRFLAALAKADVSVAAAARMVPGAQKGSGRGVTPRRAR